MPPNREAFLLCLLCIMQVSNNHTSSPFCIIDTETVSVSAAKVLLSLRVLRETQFCAICTKHKQPQSCNK